MTGLPSSLFPEDPSILSVSASADGSAQRPSVESKSGMDAITRLLESASLAAGIETKEPASRPIEPVEEPVKTTKINYSMDRLIDLSLTAGQYSGDLPDEEFWRLNVRSRPFSAQQRWTSTEVKPERKQNKPKKERRRRESRSGKNLEDQLDFPPLEEEPLVQEDETPSWLLEADQNEAGSTTIHDFEKWKAKMKLEEKKRRGEHVTDQDYEKLEQSQPVDQQQQFNNQEHHQELAHEHNNVDDFFATMKDSGSMGSGSDPAQSAAGRSAPVDNLFDSMKVGSAPSSSTNLANTEEAQPTGGSRFSSFFSPAVKPAPLTKEENLRSRMLTMLSEPSPESKSPEMGASNNDSFFMSLLSKKGAATPQQSETAQGSPSRKQDAPSSSFNEKQHQMPPMMVPPPPGLSKSNAAPIPYMMDPRMQFHPSMAQQQQFAPPPPPHFMAQPMMYPPGLQPGPPGLQNSNQRAPPNSNWMPGNFNPYMMPPPPFAMNGPPGFNGVPPPPGLGPQVPPEGRQDMKE